ncbi:MAG: DUF4038 domain-containing protein [Gammaproteobacteria bacterium]
MSLPGLPLAGPTPGVSGDADGDVPRLAVSRDGRTLIRSDDGTAFFWLGDSAWYLADLPPAGVDEYLRDRASRGFNVIQGPIIVRKPFDRPGMMPNYAGELPLRLMDEGAALNVRYMQHIDYIVERALHHGLYIALAAIWGPEFDQLLSVDDPEQAYSIGTQLGRRYKDKPNVIWIVCGEYHKIAWETRGRDRSVLNGKELGLIEALATGLEAGHGGANLMTIHPTGNRSSSEHFHAAAWLDFNMIQTFSINSRTSDLVLKDWMRRPARPVVNAEPAYEGRDMGFNNDPVTPWKVRYEAYQSVFQGAMGHTYGHSDIWNPSETWRVALDSEGARSMTRLRALMESRPAAGRAADQGLILGSGDLHARYKRLFRKFAETIGITRPETAEERNDRDAREYNRMRRLRATTGGDGHYALVYFPGADIRADLDLGALSGNTIAAWWYNPADGHTYDDKGVRQEQPEPFMKLGRDTATQSFDPPGSSHEQDWILVLDDASMNYPAPGQAWR